MLFARQGDVASKWQPVEWSVLKKCTLDSKVSLKVKESWRILSKSTIVSQVSLYPIQVFISSHGDSAANSRSHWRKHFQYIHISFQSFSCYIRLSHAAELISRENCLFRSGEQFAKMPKSFQWFSQNHGQFPAKFLILRRSPHLDVESTFRKSAFLSKDCLHAIQAVFR